MPRPLVGEQAGLEDYTVTQYLFIYSPCRVWGWGDGVSHPASLPYALGGPKTPSSGSSLWRPPSRDIVGPKVVLNALGLPTCLWVCPLFSPKPLLGDLSDQTGRSQKHKGSHPSPHRAAPWLHRAGFSMVQPLRRCMCWVRKRMLVKGCSCSSFVSASCPGSCLHVREGEIHT